MFTKLLLITSLPCIYTPASQILIARLFFTSFKTLRADYPLPTRLVWSPVNSPAFQLPLWDFPLWKIFRCVASLASPSPAGLHLHKLIACYCYCAQQLSYPMLLAILADPSETLKRDISVILLTRSIWLSSIDYSWFLKWTGEWSWLIRWEWLGTGQAEMSRWQAMQNCDNIPCNFFAIWGLTIKTMRMNMLKK